MPHLSSPPPPPLSLQTAQAIPSPSPTQRLRFMMSPPSPPSPTIRFAPQPAGPSPPLKTPPQPPPLVPPTPQHAARTAVTSAALSHTASILASGSMSGDVTLWDMRSGQPLRVLHLPTPPPTAGPAPLAASRSASMGRLPPSAQHAKRSPMTMLGLSSALLSVAEQQQEHQGMPSPSLQQQQQGGGQWADGLLGDGCINALAFSPTACVLAAGGERNVYLWSITLVPAVVAAARALAMQATSSSGAGPAPPGCGYGAAAAALAPGGGSGAPVAEAVAPGSPSDVTPFAPLSSQPFSDTPCVTNLAGRPGTQGWATTPQGSAGGPRTGSALIMGEDEEEDEVVLVQMLAVLRGHSDVRHLAFSPLGDVLVSGSGRQTDSVLSVWEVPSGRQRGVLLGYHNHAVTSVAFSPDGQFLASGSLDGSVCLWDLRMCRLRVQLAKAQDDHVHEDGDEPQAHKGRTRFHGLWHFMQKKEVVKVDRSVTSLVFVKRQPAGGHLLLGSEDGGGTMPAAAASAAAALAGAEGGAGRARNLGLLAIGKVDGSVTLIDCQAAQDWAELRMPAEEVAAVAVHATAAAAPRSVSETAHAVGAPGGLKRGGSTAASQFKRLQKMFSVKPGQMSGGGSEGVRAPDRASGLRMQLAYLEDKDLLAAVLCPPASAPVAGSLLCVWDVGRQGLQGAPLRGGRLACGSQGTHGAADPGGAGTQSRVLLIRNRAYCVEPAGREWEHVERGVGSAGPHAGQGGALPELFTYFPFAQDVYVRGQVVALLVEGSLHFYKWEG